MAVVMGLISAYVSAVIAVLADSSRQAQALPRIEAQPQHTRLVVALGAQCATRSRPPPTLSPGTSSRTSHVLVAPLWL